MKKIRNKIIDYFYETGIKRKIAVLVSTIVIVVFMFLLIVFVIFLNKKAIDNNIDYSQDILNITGNDINLYFLEVDSIANEANYNSYIQNYLHNKKTIGKDIWNYEKSINVFDYSLYNRSDATSISLFDHDNLVMNKSIYSLNDIYGELEKYEWYRKAKESDTFVITGPNSHNFLTGNTDKTISLSRKILSHENGEFLGVILIDLNLNEIKRICNSTVISEGGKLLILNENGSLLYETQKEGKKGFLSAKSIKDISNRIDYINDDNILLDVDGEKCQIVWKELDTSNWHLVLLTPTKILKRSTNNTIFIVTLIILIMLFFILLSLNLLFRWLIRPITILKEHMDAADAGNLSIRVHLKNKDEIGLLAKSFNGMLSRIENLKEQVIHEQEEKRKYEFEALQQQINPHFLYNTLDTIIWMSEAQNPNVVPMIEALAKLFRISLNKGKEVIPINDELEHVRNYLYIQKIRYGKKLNYQINIEENVVTCLTIKLIVQPVVENSIYHGIKKRKGPGKIQIHAYRKENKLYISISDDGVGMSSETLENISSEEYIYHNKDGSGIGVRNVNERIRLYFGPDYGLSYCSELGKGTTAFICLPIIEKEEEIKK